MVDIFHKIKNGDKLKLFPFHYKGKLINYLPLVSYHFLEDGRFIFALIKDGQYGEVDRFANKIEDANLFKIRYSKHHLYLTEVKGEFKFIRVGRQIHNKIKNLCIDKKSYELNIVTEKININSLSLNCYENSFVLKVENNIHLNKKASMYKGILEKILNDASILKNRKVIIKTGADNIFYEFIKNERSNKLNKLLS